MPTRYFYIAMVSLLALTIPAALLRAQETTPPQPQFLFSWKAGSYTPPGFAGKALPTVNSIITASFTLVERGNIVDLSRDDVYWYIDGEFAEGGKGLQETVFRANRPAGQRIGIRIVLPAYKDRQITYDATLPIVLPETVIDAPFPGGFVYTVPVTLRALPYFFSVSDALGLNFFWSLNGESAVGSENPTVLYISAPSGFSSGERLRVGLRVENPNNIFEQTSAASSLTLLR
jgi:hypothetical protein